MNKLTSCKQMFNIDSTSTELKINRFKNCNGWFVHLWRGGNKKFATEKERRRMISIVTNETSTQTERERVVAILTQILLYFIMTGLAATVNISDFRDRIFSKGTVIGLGLQSLVMPFFGFLLILSIPELEDVAAITLMILLSSPGGSFSNFFCALFNGDIALSVAMTSIATLLSLITLPMNLFFYLGFLLAQRSDESLSELIDWVALFRAIGIVLAAIVSGLTLNNFFPSKVFVFNNFANISAIGLLALGFLASNEDDTPLWQRPLRIVILGFLPPLVAMILAVGVSIQAELEKPQVFAVAIEVCLQNKAIATAFALTSLSGPEQTLAVSIPVIYGVADPLYAIGLAVVAFRNNWTYTPPGTPLCQALWGNFQPVNQARRESIKSEPEFVESENNQGDVDKTEFNYEV